MQKEDQHAARNSMAALKGCALLIWVAERNADVVC